MANTYKNIVITPNIGSSNDEPNIVFSGANTTANTDITLYSYPDSNGTLSFEGSAGQLFSITNDLSNLLFSVADVSGIPSFEVYANGLVSLVPVSGNVGIGTSSPTNKLQVEDASGIAIRGDSTSSIGVQGTSNSNYAVQGTSNSSVGVYGLSTSSYGVYGLSNSSYGVSGTSNSYIGVYGVSNSYIGVYGVSSGASHGGFFQSSSEYALVGRTLSSLHGGVIGYNYDTSIYGILGYQTTYSFFGNGALSKASGSFRIPHPLPELKDTHDLVHSFVESPTADNIYRGKIQLQNGQATVNIDTHSGMTEGTFAALNGNVQVFLQNDSGWDLVRGSVSDNILTIISQNQQSSDTISWLVIAERQDEHMLETGWTDEFGRPTLEPLKMPDHILPEQEEV